MTPYPTQSKRLGGMALWDVQSGQRSALYINGHRWLGGLLAPTYEEAPPAAAFRMSNGSTRKQMVLLGKGAPIIMPLTVTARIIVAGEEDDFALRGDPLNTSISAQGYALTDWYYLPLHAGVTVWQTSRRIAAAVDPQLHIDFPARARTVDASGVQTDITDEITFPATNDAPGGNFALVPWDPAGSAAVDPLWLAVDQAVEFVGAATLSKAFNVGNFWDVNLTLVEEIAGGRDREDWP